MLLKVVCVYSIYKLLYVNNLYSLSELANRIASVSAVASPSLTSACVVYTHDRSLPTFGDNFISARTKSKSQTPTEDTILDIL